MISCVLGCGNAVPDVQRDTVAGETAAILATSTPLRPPRSRSVSMILATALVMSAARYCAIRTRSASEAERFGSRYGGIGLAKMAQRVAQPDHVSLREKFIYIYLSHMSMNETKMLTSR